MQVISKFDIKMGQRGSCLSSADNMNSDASFATVPTNRNPNTNTNKQPNIPPARETKSANNTRKPSENLDPYLSKVWSSDKFSNDVELERDRRSGYNLVDLKGDKITHTDHKNLIGCEIYAPGIGIGLIVAHVSSTRHNFQYKVQMADGRNIVVAVRRCEKCDSDVVSSNLNPRIFIMQRLYGG